MADTKLNDSELIYATKGNIGFPGTSAQRTASNARGILEAAAQLGPGVTVTAVTAVAAR